jgi:hypothetical protein
MVILLTLAVWYLGAMAVCAIGLWIVCKIMDEANDKQTIIDLTTKLTERDTRIAVLAKELADLKARQFPSFITRSTFLQNPPLTNS